MKQFLFILAFAVICFSCKKDQTQAGTNLEIYLLKSSQRVALKCQVDAGSAVLEDLPVISNQDILEYDRTTYKFTFSGSSIQKLMTPERRGSVCSNC